MAGISFSDLSQSFLAKSSIQRLSGRVAQLGQELATGKTTDTGKALSGDQKQLAAIRHTRNLGETYLTAAREIDLQSSGTERILKNLRTQSQSLADDLGTATQNSTPINREVIASQGRKSLESAIANLNTSQAGSVPLAGQNINGPAVASADTILTALRATVAGATTASDAITRIEAWFNDPQGYQAVAYQGGPARAPQQISTNEDISYGPTANDPEIKGVLQSFATTALLNDSSLALSQSEIEKLALGISNQARTSVNDLITSSAKLGQNQAKIENTITQLQSANLILQQEENKLTGIEAESTAVDLEAAQTNLEILFRVTGRLSQLKLSDYI